MTVPAEVKADKKPGGDTPPSIEQGSFVSWGSNKGRVDIIVTNGKVPGVDEEVEGSKDSPAARVTVWKKGDGDQYTPTREKHAAMVQTLKRIPPLNKTTTKSAAGGEALIGLLADHERRIEDEGLGEPARVSGASVKAVYDRGLAAWPGQEKAGQSREAWATLRVEAFLDMAAGGDPVETYTRDRGLLGKAHPLHPATEAKAIVDVKPTENGGVEFTTLDQSALQAMIDDLQAPVDGEAGLS